MDKSSLSTLASMQTFIHTDVVKGVSSPIKNRNGEEGEESYLIQVLRLLGTEIATIIDKEWSKLEKLEEGQPDHEPATNRVVAVPTTYNTKGNTSTTKNTGNPCSWEQHVVPQDESLPSRKARRRGALSFFRELFNMVKMSLQQNDKNDFYSAMVCMEVKLDGIHTSNGRDVSMDLLSMMASILSDPASDISEKSSALEIVGTITLHDPNQVRRYCVSYHDIVIEKSGGNQRHHHHRGFLSGWKPMPNEKRQLVYSPQADDLLSSLLMQMAVATDAGILIQTSEILRLLLDTDMMGDHLALGPTGGPDEVDRVPPGMVSTGHDLYGHEGQTGSTDGDQNNFLNMFFEKFMQWLVVPFQFTVLLCERTVPERVAVQDSSKPEGTATQDRSRLFQSMTERFNTGVKAGDKHFDFVPPNSIRGSFAIELLSFCARTHVYRMKIFVLRTEMISTVLKLLLGDNGTTGDRCLKLTALRFLRSIVSAKDDMYNQHIIKKNLFDPVFEAFRTNPVGDNIVSSAIVEMCDFIQSNNVVSLVEHVGRKYLQTSTSASSINLEKAATPYLSTPSRHFVSSTKKIC